MKPGKHKSSGTGEVAKKGPPLGLVAALAAAGGVVVGAAGTYFLVKPSAAPTQSAAPAAGGVPQAQTVAVPARPVAMPFQQQFTPAPQPPGTPPPGKVWSAEHGHWHDAPFAPATLPVAVPAAVAPALAATPAPVAAPTEKKE